MLTVPQQSRGHFSAELPVALIRQGVIQHYVQLLEKGSVEEKVSAAAFFGKRKEKAGVPALVKALDDSSNQSVRAWAAWSLGEIGDKSAVKPLLQAFAKHDALKTRDPFGFETKCLTDFSVALDKLTGKQYGLDGKKWKQYADTLPH
jgi:hypothetical protein